MASGIYYAKTTNGIPILFLANTAFYNTLNTSAEYQQSYTADTDNLGSACQKLKSILQSYGADVMPQLWTGPRAGTSGLINAIDIISSVFYLIHIDSGEQYPNQYIGNSYGNVTMESVLYGGNGISDFYMSTTATVSNRLMDYRCTCENIYGGDGDVSRATFSFLIHVIPENAVSTNNTLIPANMGSYDITTRWEATRQGVSHYAARVTRSLRAVANSASRNLLINIPLFIPETPITDDDPYTGAGYPASTAPGGVSGGSFNFSEDGITGVHTPGLDLLNTGLITAWRPSKATLAQLASWLWTTTPGQIIQQLFGNPINAIIGLHIVPVSPPVDGGTNTIKFGVEDSQVPCPKITSQHVTVDCGSITIEPKYGSYMDYAPQTSAELFLPYVGGLPLDVNDVVDKTIAVKYQIDVLSGACVAYVFIDGVLHYQKAGGCAATAPITGSQMPNVISGVLSIVGSVAGAVATMGASGAGTAAKVASGIAAGTSVAESAANMLKQSVSYAGTISGWAGLLGAQKPYLILSVPHAAIPGGQNTLMGYPAWVSGRVGDFTGYTECTVDRVTATRATDQEVEEIKALLAGGVIL